MNVSAVACCLAASVLATPAGSVLYVDDDAPGGGDGTSWDTAYRFLTDALADAADGGVGEIRVAQGTYLPDRSEAEPQGTGDRAASFALCHGLTVRGGFAGIGADDPDERDLEAFPTVLSGDLAGDNSFHVVTAAAVDAVLDGLIVIAGNADSFDGDRWQGGGLRQDGGVITLVSCRFLQNSGFVGGAVYSSGQDVILVVESSTFVGNYSNVGGAINFRDGALDVTGCMFADNGNPGFGGGSAIFAFESEVAIERSAFSGNTSLGGALTVGFGTLAVANCVFAGNSAGFDGGAIQDANQSTSIVNCLFAGNEAGMGGGIYAATPGIEIINCTFVDNANVGLISNNYGTPQVINGIFRGNDPEQIAEDPTFPPTPATVTFSNIEGGWSGPGSDNINADPLFVGGPTGSWTAQAVFDPASWSTTYTDAAASLAPGALAGRLLAPAPDFLRLQLVIADNTETTITVLGDFALWGFPGFNYQVNDYRLREGSPSIDTGDTLAVPAGVTHDLAGSPRVIGDPCTPGFDPFATVDMGAYEFRGPCGRGAIANLIQRIDRQVAQFAGSR